MMMKYRLVYGKLLSNEQTNQNTQKTPSIKVSMKSVSIRELLSSSIQLAFLFVVAPHSDQEGPLLLPFSMHKPTPAHTHTRGKNKKKETETWVILKPN